MLLQPGPNLVEEIMAQVRNLTKIEVPELFLGVEAALQEILGAENPGKQAAAVLRLSNHYVSSPESLSPWSHAWATNALLSYYHPLNQSRAFGVANRGLNRDFFNQLDSIVDFGCGTGAATLGFVAAWPKFSFVRLSDHSPEVLKLADSLFSRIAKSQNYATLKWELETETLDSCLPPKDASRTLALFSYVLTEAHALQKFDRFLSRHRQNPFEAIAILEPSTSSDGRRLQSLRQVLLKHGYHLWAPCTHSEACPLLEESDRDWCHDRFPPFLPKWWAELESGLPMKNQTITVSYLLARRTPLVETRKQVRVIGDPLNEKTKVRQLICRGPHREFISWFPSRFSAVAKKELKDFDLARGDLFYDDQTFWRDQRGAERGHEYRLTESEIRQIQSSLADLATKSSR